MEGKVKHVKCFRAFISVYHIYSSKACLFDNGLCANMSSESCIHFNQQDL